MKGNPAIKHRLTGMVIVEAGKYTDIREAVEKESADLRYADLRSANLRSVNLRYANLRYADLRSADLRYADFYSADLRYADLYSADLRYADLRYANLRYADLRSVNLRYANLHYADLRSADLRYANLRSAKYKEPLFLPDLYALKLLPPNTRLRFWKYLNGGISPYQSYRYNVGKTYTEKNCNNDEHELCEKGLNVATLVWCLRDNSQVDEFIEVEFLVRDIVAIPYATDGKFRVKRFKVLRRINRKSAIKILNKVMGVGSKKLIKKERA